MIVNLSIRETEIVIIAEEPGLAPRHENQLAFWGFRYDSTVNEFACTPNTPIELLIKLINYFDKNSIELILDEAAETIYNRHIERVNQLLTSMELGRSMKDGIIDADTVNDFIQFTNNHLQRQLLEHQIKATLHLLAVVNGANFSVPGSGKTTVVLSAFQQLRHNDEIDSLFVVGPPSCFGPWTTEYEYVFGSTPKYEIFAGGNVEDRHDRYRVNRDSVADIYLTTFQTLHKDWMHVRNLLSLHGIRFYFVVDEAHYIKQLGGAWAESVLNVVSYASRRCILTGTPFPRSYVDAYNLFDVLWPDSSPLSSNDRHMIGYHCESNDFQQAANILDDKIGPLFYRVRKTDLNLAPQVFHDPTIILMNENEKLIYDVIVEHIRRLSRRDYIRNFDILMNLQRGRMMRLRQCVSYIRLLRTAIPEYDEDVLEGDISLANIIKNYDDFERPAKLEALIDIVNGFRTEGEKVVIWSNFIGTLNLINDTLRATGEQVEMIYGATPTENTSVNVELTREEIIRRFSSQDGGIDILVANPAACAESISLHRTCSHAIYYDLSYNCAQYLQSLDRIHRVGGSEDREAHYYFLQYDGTIDEDILSNVRRKAQNMSEVIDQEYLIYSLDMFDDFEELEAYERIFNPE
jgi:SNF2 family DNA or RNA helicase